MGILTVTLSQVVRLPVEVGKSNNSLLAAAGSVLLKDTSANQMIAHSGGPSGLMTVFIPLGFPAALPRVK